MIIPFQSGWKIFILNSLWRAHFQREVSKLPVYMYILYTSGIKFSHIYLVDLIIWSFPKIIREKGKFKVLAIAAWEGDVGKGKRRFFNAIFSITKTAKSPTWVLERSRHKKTLLAPPRFVFHLAPMKLYSKLFLEQEVFRLCLEHHLSLYRKQNLSYNPEKLFDRWFKHACLSLRFMQWNVNLIWFDAFWGHL